MAASTCSQDTGRFQIDVEGCWIDFDMGVAGNSTDVDIDVRSIWDRLRDAF